ncbi:MAG: PSD1 and planctomycete cytochrome C domain-containing protein [Fuerstiella sp.]|nr:PSD1 and planctomycete cytochrome C domain-containing protein [Fuerstiella sp.]
MLIVIPLTTCQCDVSTAADDTFFEAQIRPLLIERCYKCHSGKKTNGGLALDTRRAWQKGGESGPAIVPGKPDESLLIQAINYQSLEMPPSDAGGKLNDAEIAALTKWIRLGASDPREEVERHGGMSLQEAKSWWAFQALPAPSGHPAPNDVDRFISAKQQSRSLTANARADRGTLIRRATYDLTGLPPTPSEVEQFLADESDTAFATVVERLLNSPQYGVKWGRHWLDVVRYADTAGENTDRPLPHAWRYRNWVFDAFNSDLPYDQFVRMQLAGDILYADHGPQEMSAGIIATGYLAIARRFGHDIDKDIHLMHEDVIDNLGKNFLGLSTGCARCHDHKYDPLTAEDYYALYGIFSSTRFSFPGCEPKGQPRDLVPLLSQTQIDELTQAWQQRNDDAVAEKKQRDQSATESRKRLKDQAANSSRLLAAATVDEGASVSFADAERESLGQLALRKGEVLQLTVFPNDSHGADSTLVDLQIIDVKNNDRQWNISDVIPDLLSGNPHRASHGAAWCFLEVTDGPKFLAEKQDRIDGHVDLSAWRFGDTPSIFVNRSKQPINVWTSLPATSFFVHPGPGRPVAVAWACPDDAVIRVSGRVMDAHPSGGDGVSFRLEHITSQDAGAGLVSLGQSPPASDIVVEPSPVVPVAYGVVEGTVGDVALHKRGDPDQLGDPVPRRWVSILGGDIVPKGAGSGRRQLGDWIAQHPLTARVMVNRIWQWHFGRGLVATPNDFGSRGQRATHPELLDYLATQFIQSGFSVKTIHRLIMNSRTYQQSSDVTDASATHDAENQFLTRFPRRRLDAEEIRDSLLMAADNLDTTVAEAHPFPAESTWTFTQHNPFSAVYDTNKRSAYMMVQRQRRDPYLALFDGADPNASTPVRQLTTVPTQALYFLNSPFFHDQAVGFSQGILTVGQEQADGNHHLRQRHRIEQAFRWLYQRQPTAAEYAAAADFLEQYPGSLQEKWAAYARVLLAANEFLYLD